MIKSADLRYIGAVRVPQHSSSKVTPKPNVPTEARLAEGWGSTSGPFTVDHQRKEFVMGTKHGRVGRLQMVEPQLPKTLNVIHHPSMLPQALLDPMSVPVASYVDGVLIDPTNDTLGQLHNPDNSDPTLFLIEGLVVLGDRLGLAGAIYYDASVNQDCSILSSEWPITEVRDTDKSARRSRPRLRHA